MNDSMQAVQAEQRIVSASELRRHQGQLLFEVQTEQARLIVLRYGRAVAVIVPLGTYDKGAPPGVAPHV